MNPELSLRVTPSLGIIQTELSIEEYWAFQDRLLETERFEDLSQEDQDIITNAEKKL